jgi:hypothetical protein
LSERFGNLTLSFSKRLCGINFQEMRDAVQPCPAFVIVLAAAVAAFAARLGETVDGSAIRTRIVLECSRSSETAGVGG